MIFTLITYTSINSFSIFNTCVKSPNYYYLALEELNFIVNSYNDTYIYDAIANYFYDNLLGIPHIDWVENQNK